MNLIRFKNVEEVILAGSVVMVRYRKNGRQIAETLRLNGTWISEQKQDDSIIDPEQMP